MAASSEIWARWDADAGRIPLRVRLGVTGHRHLHDESAASAAVIDRLVEIEERFRGTATTAVAFTVVTSLAEGADQIVTQAARDVLGHRDLQIEVVLPFAPDDVERDFSSPAAHERFQTLLAAATTVSRIPRMREADAAYEAASRQVVDRADVLVAIWDGEPGGRGGTAETVAYAVRQGVPVVIVPPAGGTGPAGGALDAGLPESARVEEYNAVELPADVLGGYADQFGEIIGGSPLHWAGARVGAWALPHLVRADVLALRYQARYFRLGEALYTTAALAITAVTAQFVFAPDDAGWSLVEVGLMVLLLAGFAAGRRSGAHERWIGYRSLAEALRAAPFIALTGFGRDEGRGARTEPEEEPWYQRMFSEVWQTRPEIALDGGDAPELARILAEGWLGTQIEYHGAAVARLARSRRRLSGAVFVLFGLTLLVGLLHVAHVGGHHGTWPKVFVFLAIILPAFGAAVTGIRDQRQYRVHEQRSAAAGARLERIRRDIAVESRLPAIRRLAAEAQAAMAEENLDWSGVIEFQDLELVI